MVAAPAPQGVLAAHTDGAREGGQESSPPQPPSNGEDLLSTLAAL